MLFLYGYGDIVEMFQLLLTRRPNNSTSTGQERRVLKHGRIVFINHHIIVDYAKINDLV